jgi:hypothetical protein
MIQVSPLVEKMTERRWIRPTQGRQGEFVKSVFLPFTATGVFAITAGNSIYFQPDDSLTSDKVIITGIELVDFATNITIQSPQGSRVNISATESTLGYFVLSNSAREIIAQIPLNCLILRLNGGRPTFTYFDDFSWENCSIYFSSAGAVNSTNGAWFKVFYNKK